MREESHLDDMRAALRGDFERLEERRGEQVLLRPREQSESEPETASETSSDEREISASHLIVTSDEVPEVSKRSWIDRLLGL